MAFLGIPAATLFQLGIQLVGEGVKEYKTYNTEKKENFITEYGDLIEALASIPEVVEAIKNPESINTDDLKMLTLSERVAKKEAARNT